MRRRELRVHRDRSGCGTQHRRGLLGAGEADRHVDDDQRPALALVADPDDLAVADVPEHAAAVADGGDPQADRLDHADRLAQVDVSPTPYWSSSSMNRPAIRSLTRVCAPKPSATPAMPALASRGARSKLNSSRIIRTAMPKTNAVTRLRSTEPIASARWRRRSGTNSPGSAAAVGHPLAQRPRAWSARRPRRWSRTSRLIVRCSSQRTSDRDQQDQDDPQRLDQDVVAALGEPRRVRSFRYPLAERPRPGTRDWGRPRVAVRRTGRAQR